MLESRTITDGPVSTNDEHGKLVKTIHLLSIISGAIASIMIVASVFITCQMIFVRFVLDQSTIWQTETVVYLMTSATLLGLPYVQFLRGHVNVDLIPLLLKPKPRKALKLFSLILSIAVIGILLFFSIEFFYTAFVKNWKSDTVWGVRMWIPYLALPVGFGLFLLQLVADTIGIFNDHELSPSENTKENN